MVKKLMLCNSHFGCRLIAIGRALFHRYGYDTIMLLFAATSATVAPRVSDNLSLRWYGD